MRTLATILALVSAPLLAQPPFRGGMVGMDVADTSILRVAEAYSAAMRAGDAAAVATLYRDDAVEMPPGVPPIQGVAAIERYYRGLFAGCRFTEFELNHSEVRAAGDLGYVVGVSRETLSPAGGAPVSDTGKYLVILKRTGGVWKVAYASYSADHSPAAPVGAR